MKKNSKNKVIIDTSAMDEMDNLLKEWNKLTPIEKLIYSPCGTEPYTY
jgi:hypothetical protein